MADWRSPMKSVEVEYAVAGATSVGAYFADERSTDRRRGALRQ
jgi:hypothetical protein